jgi:hypothetical protein
MIAAPEARLGQVPTTHLQGCGSNGARHPPCDREVNRTSGHAAVR